MTRSLTRSLARSLAPSLTHAHARPWLARPYALRYVSYGIGLVAGSVPVLLPAGLRGHQHVCSCSYGILLVAVQLLCYFSSCGGLRGDQHVRSLFLAAFVVRWCVGVRCSSSLLLLFKI